ncbi:hypothetical protein COF68_05125 [Bacillus toyonensis]|uniref:hypothetical protein n=1 Tax=Bacillus toyonensis TaxID=155322 RepID=UPI000BFC2F70|nr:hypothetical protein [Bacillus toyonensis]PHE64228.1 hypothetical protein COF68_05125 [Bacillus toyonensis]
MEYTVTSKDQFVKLETEGLELTYYEVIREGSNIIKRSFGKVDDYTFSTTKEFSNGTVYWKKNGRGRMKNQGEVEDKLKEADSYMVGELGYTFW